MGYTQGQNPPFDNVSNLVFWSCLVNKLESLHIVCILEQLTKPLNLHSIDRLQFPPLTASLLLARVVTE